MSSRSAVIAAAAPLVQTLPKRIATKATGILMVRNIFSPFTAKCGQSSTILKTFNRFAPRARAKRREREGIDRLAEEMDRAIRREHICTARMVAAQLLAVVPENVLLGKGGRRVDRR